MKKLNELGVQEMDSNEKVVTNGGDFGITLAIVGVALGAISVAAYVVDNWDKAVQGYEDGLAAAKSKN